MSVFNACAHKMPASKEVVRNKFGSIIKKIIRCISNKIDSMIFSQES